MANILFLSHRIPYPPNKGDKIRSWNFLKHLLDEHNVHVGFFIDDAEDKKHVPFLEACCESATWAYRSPKMQKIASLRGLLNGTSLTENAYPSTQFRKQIASILDEQNIDLVYLYSAASWTFLSRAEELPAVVTDLVDVDSAKWSAYAEEGRFPISTLFSREARTLKRFEALVAESSCATLLVSDDEATFFQSRVAAQDAGSVVGIANGVDVSAFSPESYSADIEVTDRIIFTGAMDYAPNVQAVTWFADEVLPELLEQRPTIEFVIAGRPVSPIVARLGNKQGVKVLGGVDDMAKEIAQAAVVVAPLQTARGIQNKVLEGMAMAKPVVCSGLANEGINAKNGQAVLVADSAEANIDAVLKLLQSADERKEIGLAARAFVSENFSWPAAYAKIDQIIDGCLEQCR